MKLLRTIGLLAVLVLTGSRPAQSLTTLHHDSAEPPAALLLPHAAALHPVLRLPQGVEALSHAAAPDFLDAALVSRDAALVSHDVAPVTNAAAPVFHAAAPDFLDVAQVSHDVAHVTNAAAPVFHAAVPVFLDVAQVSHDVAPATYAAAPVFHAAAPDFLDAALPVSHDVALVFHAAAPGSNAVVLVTNAAAPVTNAAARPPRAGARSQGAAAPLLDRLLARPLPLRGQPLASWLPAALPSAQQRHALRADPVFDALEAELGRSMGGFPQRSERPPYFLGMAVWDRWEEYLASASGSILIDRSSRQRLLDVDVRVGDYDFDNTRRFQGRGGAGGGGTGPAVIPVGDDVDAIRAAVWQRTERKYRTAVERLLQLEANRATTVAAADPSGDFSREEPYTLIEDVPVLPALDRATWSDRLRRTSARFDAFPEIQRASVSLSTQREVRYLATSEGTRVRTGGNTLRVSVSASTLLDDGMELSLYRNFDATSPEGLPSEARLAAAVDTVIAELMALRGAPEVEPYNGPAILSGRASAVFFHEIFGHRIEGHRQKDEDFAQTFTNRIGEPVLPSFLSVTDDPSLRSFNGTELTGHYRVDDEGVPSRPVPLIQAGVLSGFLMGRSPIQAAPLSNGHGRREPGYDVVARQGNLIVTSSQTVSHDQLRQRLIEEIRRQNKPYGYYFDEIQGGFTYTGRTTPQSFKVLPLKVFRIYADGRPDELVRGVDIVGTPLTVFSKILATDDRPQIFNGVCGAESGNVPVSAVSPAILVQELEIEKRAKTPTRPPILPPPPTAEDSGSGVRAGPTEPDVLMRALSDEVERAIGGLRLDGLASPHYIAYRVEDAAQLYVDATFGELLGSSQYRTRRLEADVRAGSPTLDNTNFAGAGGLGAISWVEIGLDDNYDAIRRFAWRITDSRYKQAAEVLARKLAALRDRPAPEAPSFSMEPPTTRIEPGVSLEIDASPWDDVARRLSAVFRDFPALEDSRVRVQVRHLNRYIIASDGTRGRTPETSYAVVVTGVARGPGGTIRDYTVFAAPTGAGLPALESMVAETRRLAAELTARAAAETLELYTGPVLFEGVAAPQLFHALLGRQIGGIAPASSGNNMQPARRLDAMIGQRVLPVGFTVTDDPTLPLFAGVPLLGHYVLDDEGVPPRPVSVVENGLLRGLLFSRIPGRTGDRSTGHGRDAGAGEARPIIGNLFVKPATTLSADSLRAELIRLAREDGLEFGLIVRGLEDGGLVPARTGAQRGRSEIPPPLAVYKLHADGRETPLRDVDFSEATMRALRGIVAAGDRPVVYNFLQDGGSAALRWGATPVSLVAPAVLFGEMDLQRSESGERAPVLGHPFFDGPPGGR